jgi:hypothetical protein
VSSTNQAYESKWKLFDAYCRGRNIDPFQASPAAVADFLLWVAKTRQVSFSTLSGYRSAIGQALKLSTGYNPSEDPVLSQLMKSFKRTQPAPRQKIPQWDIDCVFEVLMDPAHANEKLDALTLTCKTVFLLALASGDRRQALAALMYPPKFESCGVTINYNPKFVPKSYYMRKNVAKIAPLHIPSVPAESCGQVCPCETLRFYVASTASARSVQSSLFIPHEGRATNITPQRIARYIINLIKFCYTALERKVPVCSAHDVRKIAASLRALTGESMSDVLEAGQWSSPNTFLKHYFLNLSPPDSCGQMVAGRKLISSSSFQAAE